MDAKLLNKYIAGDALPEEKKEVIRWMKESEENREQLMQLPVFTMPLYGMETYRQKKQRTRNL